MKCTGARWEGRGRPLCGVVESLCGPEAPDDELWLQPTIPYSARNDKCDGNDFAAPMSAGVQIATWKCHDTSMSRRTIELTDPLWDYLVRWGTRRLSSRDG